MTHRAEQIVATIVTTLTGLTTTGANVFRGREYNIPDTNLPALKIYMGTDTKLEEYSQGQMDWELSIRIVGVVKSTGQIDTTLNLIRNEITVALQADHTQGLGFLLDSIEGDAAEPIFSVGDQQIAEQELEWQFMYRRSRNDPGI